MEYRITVSRRPRRWRASVFATGLGDGDDADHVCPAPVDDGRSRLAVDHVDTSAGERKPSIGKIQDLRRESDLAVEPGLHSVAIARSDIEGRRCQQGALVTGDDRRDFVRGCGLAQTEIRAAAGQALLQ